MEVASAILGSAVLFALATELSARRRARAAAARWPSPASPPEWAASTHYHRSTEEYSDLAKMVRNLVTVLRYAIAR